MNPVSAFEWKPPSSVALAEAPAVAGLERDGLVTRTVFPTVPARVDHELTDLGRGLSKSVEALGKWAFDHKVEIEGARAKFDGKKC